jgi:DNA-binding protein WhiA
MGIWGGTTDDERKQLVRNRKHEIRPKRAVNVQAVSVRNLSAANEKKKLESASKAAIELQKAIELVGKSVPQTTVELAKLRINHPTLSLGDLGMLMKPALTKDQVHGKLHRLMKTYKKHS